MEEEFEQPDPDDELESEPRQYESDNFSEELPDAIDDTVKE